MTSSLTKAAQALGQHAQQQQQQQRAAQQQPAGSSSSQAPGAQPPPPATDWLAAELEPAAAAVSHSPVRGLSDAVGERLAAAALSTSRLLLAQQRELEY
jgi:hypothetical protein